MTKRLLILKEDNDTRWILQEILNSDQKIKYIDGRGLSSHRLFEEAQPDLFENTDLFIILYGEELKVECQKFLLNFSYPLIVVTTGLRSDHFLRKIGCVITDYSSEKPYEREKRLTSWLEKQIKKFGKVANCSELLKQVGMDQELLMNEVEKLICYVGERKEITTQDIHQVCPKIPTETIWQWGEAFLKRDAASAWNIGKNLLSDGQAFIALLKSLRSQFQTAFQVATMTMDQIQKTFPYMKGRILEHHLSLSKSYGSENFTNALLCIDQMDLLARNGNDDSDQLLILLIAKL